jgi:hypothetical protein
LEFSVASIKVIYANDLSSVPHFGCKLVNENLKDAIRGMAILIGTVPHDHLADPQSFRMLNDCDVLVINGEGNFHGRNLRKLGEIVALATEGRKLGKRVALINTVGQDIPAGLDLSVFDFVSVRESESEEAFREAGYKGDLMVAPDGTLLTEFTGATLRGNQIIVTDSVLSRQRRELRSLTRDLRGRGLDVVYAPFHRKWKDIVCGPFRRGWFQGKSVESILALFGSAQLIVSGRFHANCFALITQTPVVSIDSNTHKTRSMMHDFALADHQHFDDIGKLRSFVFGALDKKAMIAAVSQAQLDSARQTIRTSLQRALGITSDGTASKA